MRDQKDEKKMRKKVKMSKGDSYYHHNSVHTLPVSSGPMDSLQSRLCLPSPHLT